MGKLVNIDWKEVLTVEGEVTRRGDLHLSEVMKGATAGKAVWDTHFKLWQAVPTKMLLPLVTEIRKRKRLSPEPTNPAEFIDKEQ